VSSGAAAVLIDTIPLWAALLGATLLSERLRAWGWAGLALGFAGAVLIAAGEDGAFTLGNGVWLLLSAAAAFAVASVVQKPLLPKYGAAGVTAWTFLFGTIGLLWAAPQLLPQVERAPRGAMLCVLFLALFPGALAYVMWNQALMRLPVAIAASGLYLIPPLTFLIAWAWLGETPALLSIAGAVVALAGVALVQFKGRPARA
jgi:drug/metabolite transporter (DMT)-like permease